MGYYVSINSSHWALPLEHEAAALQALKDLNKPENNHLKRGGSYTGGEKNAHWFSWMDADYDQKYHYVKDILEALGFECFRDSQTGDLHILHYDGKIGQEELFLHALAPFVRDGSFIEWTGEDGARWRYRFEGGEMFADDGVITWVNPTQIAWD